MEVNKKTKRQTDGKAEKERDKTERLKQHQRIISQGKNIQKNSKTNKMDKKYTITNKRK